LSATIRSLYPLALLEEQGMGTAYEYYSKLRVVQDAFAQATKPDSLLVLGLPEKHGYDLDLLLVAQQAGASLTICEDRPEVLAQFERALDHLPDPSLSTDVERVQLDSLTDWRAIEGRHYDWLISTAAVQRLPDAEIVAYVQNARQHADHCLLFIPNLGNRAHLTLSGLRGLDRKQALALCAQAGAPHSPRLLSSGFCDIPPFPPGLQRSSAAKENALHSPIERLAMRVLEWWCRAERWMPGPIQKKWAHLIYVALDLRQGDRDLGQGRS
jgi:hypothetical protein